MGIPLELLNLYRGLTKKELFYIKTRWLLNPLNLVESHVPRKGRIYDIGCGAGLLSNTMALRSEERDIVGIDLSEDKINMAQKSVNNRKNVNFEKADALNFNFQKPNTAVMCDLLHHISPKRQELLLGCIYEALSDNGVLIIQDIDKKPFFKYLFALGTDKVLGKGRKVHYRSGAEMSEMLKKIGFKPEFKRIDKGYPIAAVLFKCRK